MKIEVLEAPLPFSEYAKIPIAFEVSSFIEVEEKHASAPEFELTERRLARPYIKDYDAIEGEQPDLWPKRFDVSNWTMLMAKVESRNVGGAVVAFNTPGLSMLEERDDLAVLWDLRVVPKSRNQGIGSALFRAAEAWAKERGCRYLKVETQNTNVSACRFYERQGCVLSAVVRQAYPQLPDEIQLLWYKNLA